jgi:hypothetical protein
MPFTPSLLAVCTGKDVSVVWLTYSLHFATIRSFSLYFFHYFLYRHATFTGGVRRKNGRCRSATMYLPFATKYVFLLFLCFFFFTDTPLSLAVCAGKMGDVGLLLGLKHSLTRTPAPPLAETGVEFGKIDACTLYNARTFECMHTHTYILTCFCLV